LVGLPEPPRGFVRDLEVSYRIPFTFLAPLRTLVKKGILSGFPAFPFPFLVPGAIGCFSPLPSCSFSSSSAALYLDQVNLLFFSFALRRAFVFDGLGRGTFL